MSIQEHVAGWLCDEFGYDDDADEDFAQDARDFIEFMNAKGIALVNNSTHRAAMKVYKEHQRSLPGSQMPSTAKRPLQR